MASAASIGSLGRLWRYYQAGILNTLFGYGVYALLLKLGVWMYAAQLIAHMLGIVFNYFSYSRHVFRADCSIGRFVLSYAGNYLVGLAALAISSQFIGSPYAAGLLAIIVVSLVNYFVLKHFVFHSQLS